MLSVGKVVLFNRFVAIFSKHNGSFSPKIVGEKKSSNSVFGCFKTKKKIPMNTKLEGGAVGG